MEDIANRVIALRKKLGLSQEEFAAKMHLGRGVVMNVEYQKVAVKDNFILNVCDTFHVSEPWLRTGEGEMFAARSLDQELAALAEALMKESDESFRKRFIAALLQLPPEFWPELERFVESLRMGGTP